MRDSRRTKGATSALNTDTPAILLGGAANGLSVARCLGRRGVPVVYLGSRSASVASSRYLHTLVEVDELVGDGYLAGLRRPATPRGVVISLGDRGNECVANYRSEMVELGYTVMEADDTALSDMLDKERSYEIAKKAQVRAPRTAVLTDSGQIADALADIGFPAALKPRISHHFAAQFAGKAVMVDDVEQAEQAAQEIMAAGVELLVTEVIVGPEGSHWGYYVYVGDDGKPLFQFTKRKLRQYPLGFGLGTLHRMEHNPDVIELGWKFMREAGVRGLVNAEFKHDAITGDYVLIESNHRITAANELILRSGVDLAEFIYRRLTDQPPNEIPMPTTNHILWWPLRDAAAAAGQIRAREISLWGWLKQLRGRIILPALSLDDPKPAVAATASSLRKVDRHARRLLGRR